MIQIIFRCLHPSAEMSTLRNKYLFFHPSETRQGQTNGDTVKSRQLQTAKLTFKITTTNVSLGKVKHTCEFDIRELVEVSSSIQSLQFVHLIRKVPLVRRTCI